MTHFIQPNWPAPSHVKAFSSTRKGGHSQGIYAGLNLGLHVQDDSQLVWKNRQELVTSANLPQTPFWLNQTHSTIVLPVSGSQDDLLPPEADASVTSQPEQVCIVMTADCLPLLVCDKSGTQVAAIHAGWRGLLNGIIENTLAKFSAKSTDLLVWLGPAISQQAFQVGSDVRMQFMQQSDGQAESAFIPDAESLDAEINAKWRADLYLLAKQRLQTLGVPNDNIYGGEYCTYQNAALFYSYRRDGQTGRQASFIYLESEKITPK